MVKKAYQLKFILILILIFIFLPRLILAGDCKTLKDLVNKNINDKDATFFTCEWLSLSYYEQGYEYFASPTVINKIKKADESGKKLAYEISAVPTLIE